MTATASTTRAGDLRYAMDHTWARLPAGCAWGITHGIAVDRAGCIHVLHTASDQAENRDCAYVFSPDGEFLRSWGAGFQGSAHGIEIVEEDGADVAYVTDLERGLSKCSLDGEILWQVDKPAFYRQRPQLTWCPSNVAVADDGRVFLADGYGSYFITVFDRDGRELGVIGGPGPEDKHLVHPHGLGIDRRRDGERLVVCDNLLTRLHYLELDGTHIATSAADDLVHPRHVAWHGELMAVPDLVGRVTLFGPGDVCLGHLGESSVDFQDMFQLREQDPSAFTDGEFVAPHDAAFDPDGNLYVTDWVECGRVTKLTRLG